MMSYKKFNMNNKTSNTILLVFFLFLLFLNGWFYQNYMQEKKEKEQILTSLEGYKLENKEFRKLITKDSATIVIQSQTILTQQEAIRLGLLKLEDRMKKVESQVGYNYDFYVDTVTVPFVPKNFGDTTGFVRIENGKRIQDSVAVPQSFALKTEWFNIAGDVRKNGLFLDSVSIPNKSTVTVGWEKRGFLKKMKPVVQIKNDNPHIRINGVNNVVIKKPKGFLQKKAVWLGLGIISGIFIHSKL